MYSYYIVKAGENAPEERISRAIKNFNYENVDVICIAMDGYTYEIETVYSIRRVLNDFVTNDIDELAKKYIEHKQNQASE